jgi:WD40 repeat protein
MPYGQEGRAAVVYQLAAGGDKRALKVFKPRFRVPAMVTLTDRLAHFASLQGLRVCSRTVLTPRRHTELLREHPDLVYSVLMPWVDGPTWMEVVLEKTALTPEMSLRLAHSFAESLEAMEERGVAHCDLSGPNLLLPALAPLPDDSSPAVELVDLEQLFGPGLEQPTALPAGSPGYAHKIAPRGLWQATADRFAGALIIAEMLIWHDSRAREASWGESFFDPDETQEAGKRYHVMRTVLSEEWGEAVADLFDLAWTSERLTDCPTFGEWLLRLPGRIAARPSAQEADEVTEKSKDSPVLSPQSSVPPDGSTQPAPTTAAGVDGEGSLQGEGSSLAARLLEEARVHQKRGEVDAALGSYREAYSLLAPDSAPAREIAELVASLQSKRQQEIEELFDEAVALRLDGNLRAARELLTEVERRHPGYESEGLPAKELLADLESRLAAPHARPAEAEPLADHAIIEQEVSEPTPSEARTPSWAFPEESPIAEGNPRIAPAEASTPTEDPLPPREPSPKGAVVPLEEPQIEELPSPEPPPLMDLEAIFANLPDPYPISTLSPGEALEPEEIAPNAPDGWGSAPEQALPPPYMPGEPTFPPPAAPEQPQQPQTPYDPWAATRSPLPPLRSITPSETHTPPAGVTQQEPVVSWQPPSHAQAVQRQRPGWLIPAVVAALLLLFGTIAIVILMAQPGPGVQVQPTPTAQAQGQPTNTSQAGGPATQTTPAPQEASLLKSFKIEGSVPHNFAISPDGQLIATVEYGQAKEGYDGATFHLALWRAEDGELVVKSSDYHLGDVYSIFFSPDGGLVATASGDATVKVWNTQDAALTRTLEGHQMGVRSLSFSPDGQTLASGSEDGGVQLWRLLDGELLGALVDGDFYLGNVENLAFSPDGQTVAAAAYDETADKVTVRMWQLSDRKLSAKYEGGDWRTTLVFTPDGANLLIGNNEEGSYLARLIRASDGETVATYQTESATGGCSGAALSPNGQIVAALDDSTGVLTLFKANDGAVLNTLQVDGATGKPVFTPDSQSVAVVAINAQDTNDIQFWSVQSSPAEATEEPASSDLPESIEITVAPPNIFAIAPDGERIATIKAGASTYDLALWAALNGDLLWLSRSDNHTKEVNSIAYSPDGEMIATGSADATVKLWNAPDATLAKTLEGHNAEVLSLAFSPDGQFLVSASDSQALVWALPEGNLLLTLQHSEALGRVTDIAFSHDGQTLAIASIPQSIVPEVKLWRVSNWEPYNVANTEHATVAFSPDGSKLLLARSTKELARLVAIQSFFPEPVFSSPDALEGSSGAALSPDGNVVAVVENSSGKLILFNSADGSELLKVADASATGEPVFMPDGQFVVTLTIREEGKAELRYWKVP